MSVNEKMTAIADAIRDKTGGTELLTLDAMASGVAEVYEAGKQKEWSDFWDIFQNYGKRTDYEYAFSSGTSFGVSGWTDVTFKPKYDIKPKKMPRAFRRSAISDLVKIFTEQGIVLDTTNCTDFNLAFGDMSNLGYLPPLDCSLATNSTAMNATFNYDFSLHTIEKIKVSENVKYPNTFLMNTALKNIIFEGVIGQSISFSYSPLSVESMKSVITHLKNYAGTDSEGTYTLTLIDTCKTALQEDTETVELDGVSYTYFELITAKGWNLA